MTDSNLPLSRRNWLLGAASTLLAAACVRAPANAAPSPSSVGGGADAFSDSEWRRLSEADWRTRLSPEAFAVLRKEATERPFSSALNDEKRKGVFHCAGCDLALFSSETKYDSGTGWPSFWDALPGAMGTKVDNTLWMERIEYHCARCEGHQGHVFDDGPAPTGKRWCNNGVALTFRAA
jgi:peptide-methionine (R)-S-oxide reductase